MATQTRRVKLTYEDYALFPEDGKRHEIIDGDHYVTPAPSTKHQWVSGRLFQALDSHAVKTGAGRVLYAPTDVVLCDTDVVQPDILFVSSARAAIITEKDIQGPPDLVIEILSDKTRRTDSLVKRKLYERYLVREYWIVDPELETVIVYRLSGESYARVAELSAEAKEALETPLLPGFTLPLQRIFG